LKDRKIREVRKESAIPDSGIMKKKLFPNESRAGAGEHF